MEDKELKELAEIAQLTFDAANNVAYGNIKGYDTVVKMYEKDEYTIFLSIACPNQIVYQGLTQFLKDLPKSHLNVINTIFENKTLIVRVGSQFGYNSTNIMAILQDLTDYFTTSGVVNVCKYCGAQSKQIPVINNGSVNYMCERCNLNAGKSISQNPHQPQYTSTKKGNMFTGLIGALLGSLIGVALWVLIYQFGYIAGIAGLAIFIFAVKGYFLLGGKPEMKGFVLCILLTIVMIFVAEHVGLGVSIYRQWKKDYDIVLSIKDIYVNIKLCWKLPDVRIELIKELGMGYLFFIIVSIPTMRKMLS